MALLTPPQRGLPAELSAHTWRKPHASDVNVSSVGSPANWAAIAALGMMPQQRALPSAESRPQV
jgi:hypothetical protein